jgi:hypothetical protein
MTETVEEVQRRIREGYHEYGEVRCSICEEFIDLTGAESVREAGSLYNEHLFDQHKTTPAKE